MAHKIGILSHPPTEIHSMGSLSGTGVTDDKMASYRHLVHNIQRVDSISARLLNDGQQAGPFPYPDHHRMDGGGGVGRGSAISRETNGGFRATHSGWSCTNCRFIVKNPASEGLCVY